MVPSCGVWFGASAACMALIACGSGAEFSDGNVGAISVAGGGIASSAHGGASSQILSHSTGGDAAGGIAAGGVATGREAAGGVAAGGIATGVDAAGGVATGGVGSVFGGALNWGGSLPGAPKGGVSGGGEVGETGGDGGAPGGSESGAAGSSSAGGTANGGASAGGAANDGASAGAIGSGGASTGATGNGGATSAGAATSGGSVGNGGASATACGVMINEIQVASSGSPANEFVELYNSCATTVALSGYKLVYRAAGGSSDLLLFTFEAGHSIAGKSFFVLGGDGYSGPSSASLGGGMNGVLAASAGGLALRNASGAVLDSVGYGNANNACVEGTAAVAPTLGTSIGRVPDGVDTQENWRDFSATTPTPGAPNH